MVGLRVLKSVVLSLVWLSYSSINGFATVLQAVRCHTPHMTFVHLSWWPLGSRLEYVSSRSSLSSVGLWIAPEILLSPLLWGTVTVLWSSNSYYSVNMWPLSGDHLSGLWFGWQSRWHTGACQPELGLGASWGSEEIGTYRHRGDMVPTVRATMNSESQESAVGELTVLLRRLTWLTDNIYHNLDRS